MKGEVRRSTFAKYSNPDTRAGRSKKRLSSRQALKGKETKERLSGSNCKRFLWFCHFCLKGLV